jgi:uncharacterized protein (DUF2235 family)
MKHLALFMDGTWADPSSNTNVSQLRDLVAPANASGAPQETWYDPGVGTTWGERLRGGIFGFGLMDNVAEGYRWLVSRYQDGDRIYLFGWSRGAFTARSLAGVVARCGLLREAEDEDARRVVDRYRQGSAATPLYRLEWLSSEERERLPAEDRWLLDRSRRVDVHFIGVWDTVGALGVPFGNLPGISRRSQQFHNTNPSVIYTNMFHALAIDENRGPFDATLWTDFQEPGEGPPQLAEHQRLEQRWFVGSHSDVGRARGGTSLGRIPLAWIQQMADEAGLGFTDSVSATAEDRRGPVRDSYASFLKGTYRFLRLGRGRHWRAIGRPPRPTKRLKGLSYTLNETIDESVFDRWRDDPGYRPANLADWAKRSGNDPAGAQGTIDA